MGEFMRYSEPAEGQRQIRIHRDPPDRANNNYA